MRIVVHYLKGFTMKKIVCLMVIVVVSTFVTSCNSFVSNMVDVVKEEKEVSNARLMYVQAEIAESVANSLSSGAGIYVAMQRKAPEVFSDYVVLKGNAEGQYTMSLELVADQLKKVEGIETTDMVLDFDSGLVATYNLDGYNVSYKLNEDMAELEKAVDPEMVAKNHLKKGGYEALQIIVDYTTLDELSAEEACEKTIEELNQDGEMSYYTPSLPLFGTEPAEGVVTINSIGSKTVEVVAYGKNKEILFSKKFSLKS